MPNPAPSPRRQKKERQIKSRRGRVAGAGSAISRRRRRASLQDIATLMRSIFRQLPGTGTNGVPRRRLRICLTARSRVARRPLRQGLTHVRAAGLQEAESVLHRLEMQVEQYRIQS
jgi:hypothetical protein